MSEIKNYIKDFEKALLQINRIRIEEIINQVKEQFQPIQIIDDLISPALQNIGNKWDKGIVGLAQIYMAARICEDFLDKLISFKEIKRKDQVKIAIAVLEDYHGLGKTIIQMLLHTSGYEIIDYGIGISIEDLITHIKKDNIEILLISTLMLRSALKIKNLKEKINEIGLNTKIIVGGAPFIFDRELWKTVGADYYGRNASEAIQLISQIIGGQSR